MQKMSAIDTFRASAHAGHAGVFAKLFTKFAAWNEARRTRAALAGLSDRELADIGLTRYEAENIGR